MSQRSYNNVWTLGRLVVQVMQKSQHEGIVVDLLPGAGLALFNKNLIVGLAFNWIVGIVNIGIMNKQFYLAEINRRRLCSELAKKRGLTVKQYRLSIGRWSQARESINVVG